MCPMYIRQKRHIYTIIKIIYMIHLISTRVSLESGAICIPKQVLVRNFKSFVTVVERSFW